MVSVVLALYNGGKYIADQVSSILSQTERDLELVVVDDVSTDEGPSIIAGFVKNDPRVRFFQNKNNLGISANFLHGVSLVSGDYVCFSDQDDVWRGDKIAILKGLLEKDSGNMLAYSDLEVCDENLQPTHASFWSAAGIQPKKGHLRERAFLRNMMPGCSILFRREVKEMMGKAGNDAPFMHDHMAYVIASELGKIIYTRKKLVRYRQHPRNNIGAFYPSVHENEKFIQSIRLKAACANNLEGMQRDRLDRLGRFCDSMSDRGFWRRVPYMPYYLDLRKDTLKDKSLGVLECLMPDAYRWLRAKTR